MPNKNTLFVGKVIHHFEALPSTNLYALELLSKSKPSEGTVISAAAQTAGRGQLGSGWHSPAGESLSVSVILYPSFLQARRQFYLTITAALALRDTLARYAENPVLIKWPNDIYLGTGKIAGILIQNQLAGQAIQYCIIGSGINVNQTAFPAELPQAVSLYQDTGQRQAPDELLDHYLLNLEQRYLQLRAGNTDRLLSDYYEHLLGYQIYKTYTQPDGAPFEAQIVGIDEIGRLKLRTSDGKEQAFGLKEVQLLL